MLRRARPGADLSSARAAGPAGRCRREGHGCWLAEQGMGVSVARVRVLVSAAGVDQVHELVTDSDSSGGRAPSNRAVKGRRERG
jgi:hypothetical protein